MSKAKLISKLFLVSLFFVCLPITASVTANNPENITETGIDFLTQPPTEETVYIAGGGTVTYTPARNEKNAVITFENATINGRKTAYYQDRNKASAALLAAGNIDMVLFGENKVTVTEKYTQGLFFFNGNVNIDGPGSLSIEILTDLSGPPGIGLLNGKNAEPTMGNFTLRGGSIHLNLALNDFSYCLSAGKNITLEGGTLTTEGGSCSIVSTGGNIDILNAAVSCKDFDDCGLLTNNGDISIAGEDTLLNISALKDTPYTIGISAEKRAGTPHILINGGTVNISAAQGGIYADSGGDITVSEGKISVKAESADSGSAAVGIWATGTVNIVGGTVSASGIANTGVGIYSDISVTVSGGDVTAKGTTQAVSHAPDMTGYKYADIIAAVDFEGYQKEDFSPEEIENYQYLHISPTTAQCSVKYENGQAIIEASQSTDAAVIFAFYNAAGRLTDFEIQNISLSEGENVVIPRHFPSYEGNAKIMLWNNISDIRPLCESEFFALPVQ